MDCQRQFLLLAGLFNRSGRKIFAFRKNSSVFTPPFLHIVEGEFIGGLSAACPGQLVQAHSVRNGHRIRVDACRLKIFTIRKNSSVFAPRFLHIVGGPLYIVSTWSRTPRNIGPRRPSLFNIIRKDVCRHALALAYRASWTGRGRSGTACPLYTIVHSL